eukprot:1358645-Amorphochlora_amoeboformis.AAC.1
MEAKGRGEEESDDDLNDETFAEGWDQTADDFDLVGNSKAAQSLMQQAEREVTRSGGGAPKVKPAEGGAGAGVAGDRAGQEDGMQRVMNSVLNILDDDDDEESVAPSQAKTDYKPLRRLVGLPIVLGNE